MMAPYITGSWVLKLSAVCVATLAFLPIGETIFAQNLDLSSNLTIPGNGGPTLSLIELLCSYLDRQPSIGTPEHGTRARVSYHRDL